MIDLWRIDLAAWDPADEGLLAPDERLRASRFLGEGLRRRFVTGRAALRRILADRIGVEPSQLVFGYGAQGKPSLISVDGVSFNVSHSADLMICALADGRRLGVDVEREPEGKDLMAIARRHFSARELSEMEAAGSTQLRERFTACWTRKEAAIKATGLGISTPLADFSVPTQPGALRAAIEVPDRDGRAALTLQSFDPAPGFAAAVAAEGDGWRIVERGFLRAVAAT